MPLPLTCAPDATKRGINFRVSYYGSRASLRSGRPRGTIMSMIEPPTGPGVLGQGVRLTNWQMVEGGEIVRRFPAFGEILALVERKKGERRMATRRDIDPVTFKRFLPLITLFDLVRDRSGAVVDATIRLMGTEVVHFYGEFTGRPVSAYPDPAVPARIIACGNYLVRHRVPVAASVDGLREGKKHVGLRILYVPLSEDDVRVDRAVSFSLFYFPSLER
ncbi:MAG: PAS domain-containing protein [Alphaproteobacteria bacterium]|nr:MAG: PAS domain-containing protein [Alphaproteobacteria bacterium]